jgi:hypothetical protein
MARGNRAFFRWTLPSREDIEEMMNSIRAPAPAAGPAFSHKLNQPAL